MDDNFNGNSSCIIQPSTSFWKDIKRAREFYRYLQPDNLIHPNLRRRSSAFDVQQDHVPSLSNALAPFCQLACLRCNVSKAMLNVMDRDMMYFLAEANMRINAAGEGQLHEDPIFVTCSTAVPVKGRICEMVLKMDKPEDSTQIPTFVVPDLSKSQFADMNIIAGPPHYRFYAGVPITTGSGVIIGSLALMDITARPDGLTPAEEEFLGKTAEHIMTYLETNRQAIEGRRARRMAEGLEAFISGRKSLVEESSKQLSDRTLKRRARAAYGIALESEPDSVPGTERFAAKYQSQFQPGLRSNSIVSLESEISSSAQSTDSEAQQEKDTEGESRSHVRTFSRAANLLRECLGDLGEDGSVHFLSLTKKWAAKGHKPHSINGNTPNLPRVPSLTEHQMNGTDEGKYRNTLQTSVIASSTAAMPVTVEADEPRPRLALDDEALRDFMRRYPGGRLWSLDDSAASSSEDDLKHGTNGHRLHRSDTIRRISRRKQSEIVALRAAFPNARQVLFVPIWDSTTGSFAYGCFITTSLESRPFSMKTDLSFLNSFCSTVMAECSRLDAMMADKQKSDFVGTISHEMRSPLHGVLASVEFLADTDVTSFQKSLIETIDSCGRTLLDTINHVLDFSKVNSFQKQWQTANKRGAHGTRRNHYLGPDNSSKAVTYGAPPLLQLFGVTDVSSVLEEVVDGLVLGHTYSSGIDITDTSREARGRANGVPGASPSARLKADAVEIILDITHGDWTFMTQPGAVRRIIMNITGNAMKYTSQGTIKVRLQQREAPEDSSNSRIMVLTVTDTGKGISPEFLASRLFVPFAQENALAPGTGLGMSIVRSIVLMLGGTIDVKSRVGKGTTVEVALPMKRPLPGQVSTQNTPHSGATGMSGNSTGDDSIMLLQQQACGETVTFYRSQPSRDDPLTSPVQHYIQQWYGLDYVDQRLLEASSVVIVEEEDLEHLMTKAVGTPGKRPVLVIMCSVSSRHSNALITSLEERLSSPVEFVARPCGPNKLARTIRMALEKKRTIKPRFPQVANLGVIPEVMTPNSSIEASTPCDPAGKPLQELDLGGPGVSGTVVHATETFAASQVSQNAQMAIRDPQSAGLRTPRNQMSDCDAFPFPVQPDEKSRQRRERAGSRGALWSKTAGTAVAGIVEASELKSPLAAASFDPNTKVDPHVLLVDDNKINLKLLETYLKRKRNYTRIEKAEDGQQAVNSVTSAKEPYDIIFMDISMPVMNGFEATRAIRDHEEQFDVNPGAMVIALTGLASGRDQSEGFDSGCDIYMTKPVSFQEVGRLLDNWEGHQKAYIDQDLPEETAKLNLNVSPPIGISAQVNGDRAE